MNNLEKSHCKISNTNATNYLNRLFSFDRLYFLIVIDIEFQLTVLKGNSPPVHARPTFNDDPPDTKEESDGKKILREKKNLYNY